MNITTSTLRTRGTPASRANGPTQGLRSAPRLPLRPPSSRRRGCPGKRSGDRGFGDGGFGAVELVLLVPAIVLALLLVVAVGRVEQARLQVTGAARDAARAASLTRSATAAQDAAQTSATVALSAESVTCTGGPIVSLDVTHFEPGGLVEVTVTCAARLGDLGFPSLPTTKTLTATAASPLEQYRSQP